MNKRPLPTTILFFCSFFFLSLFAVKASAIEKEKPTPNISQPPVDVPFITRWDLTKPGSGTNDQISFNIASSGTVTYTWQEVSPGSSSGSGTFSGTTPIITGLPTNAIVDLSIAPTNLQRFYIENGPDKERLIDVQQWGSTAWTSMNSAFYGCSNVEINALDNPNLIGVADMSLMFAGTNNFRQDIGDWDVSKVTNMSQMFLYASAFNGNIADWDVSNVTSLSGMFMQASDFNQDLSSWNVNLVTDMTNIFKNSDISLTNYDKILIAWDAAGYTNKNLGDASPLRYCAGETARTNLLSSKGWTIAGDVSGCTTTNLVADINPSFENEPVTFTATIAPSSATGTVTFKNGTTELATVAIAIGEASYTTSALALGSNTITAEYHGDQTNASSVSNAVIQDIVAPFITRWDLSIAGSAADQISFEVETSGTVDYSWVDINNPLNFGSNTFSGTTATITGLPAGATIDLSISPTNFQRFSISTGPNKDNNRLIDVKQWGTTNWTRMQNAFATCFNLQISAIDAPNLSAVMDMSGMFAYATAFNQDISGWETGTVTNMSQMFEGASSFNQNIGTWDVSQVTNMSLMFSSASAFNQDLSGWNANLVTDMTDIFKDSDLSLTNYDNTLIGWNTANYSSKNMGDASPLQYCAGLAARTNLIANGWVFSGDTYSNSCLEIDLKGNNVAISDGHTTPSFADHTDFGFTVLSGNAISRTFTIENSGTGVLNLTGSSKVAINGSFIPDFTLTQVPAAAIPGGTSTTFVITFNPTAAGLRTAEVRIENDDPDENPYTFRIQGTGVCTPLTTSPGNVDITWTGAVSTDWNTPCNWTPAWVPDLSNARVVVPFRTNKPIINGIVPDIKAVYLSNSATLTINESSILNVRGNNGVDKGVLVEGTLTNNGTLNIESSTQGAIDAYIYLRNGDSRVVNNGTMNISSTDEAIGVGYSNISSFENNSTGVINIKNGIGIEIVFPTDRLNFTNLGVINYNGNELALSLQGYTNFVNEGSIHINSGTGISILTPSSLTNRNCGKIIMQSGTYSSTGTTINSGLIQMPDTYDFSNSATATFNNFGVLKANTLVGFSASGVTVSNSCPVLTSQVSGRVMVLPNFLLLGSGFH